MKNSIVKKECKYSTALVPDANSVQEVFDAWKEAGLEPVEVSEEDLISEIKITAAKHTGEMKWDVKKADGIRAMSLMALTMKDMFEEYLKNSGRPKLASNSPDTKIAIQLENGEVKMAYNQSQDPMVLKGLLLACLWKLIDQCKERSDEIHPLDLFTGLLQFNIDENDETT